MTVARKYSPAIVLAAVMAAAAVPAAAGQTTVTVDAPDLVKMMDPNAPKYATAECVTAREAAAKYDPSVLGAMMEGAALGLLGPIGIIIAANEDEKQMARARKVMKDLVDGCGQVSFAPYFKARADKGDEDAMAWLGYTYSHADPPDGAAAVHWYEMGVARENAASENNLAILYYNGKLVPQDTARAEALWTRAADHGSAEGETNLGELYLEQKRYDDARKHLVAGARRGLAEAQFYVGRVYEEGWSVDRNDKIAFFWFSVAAENGYSAAEAARDAAAARLEPGAVSYAKRRVTECKVRRFRQCKY